MARSTKGWKWVTRDAWVLCKGDSAQAKDVARDLKENWPKGSIRTAKRTLRAGGLAVPLTVVMVREREECCTCGRAYERGYVLAEACAYCARGNNHLSKEVSSGKA